MATTLTKLLVHAVFSTKLRADLIDESIESELHRYIGGVCRNHASALLAAGGTANHIHLLIDLAKTVTLADLLMHIKKDSSKWIKTKPGADRAFQWQDGYAGFTIGESQVKTLHAYFDRQKAKHKRMTFEDELVAFLKKYNVPYDPKYVFD